MKKILLLVSICISCSSCCTLFSSSKQDITFTGMNGTKIYEASTKQKIAEIKEYNKVNKRRSVQKEKRRQTVIGQKGRIPNHSLCLGIYFQQCLPVEYFILARLLSRPGHAKDEQMGQHDYQHRNGEREYRKQIINSQDNDRYTTQVTILTPPRQ